jgi:hypothetical protein
MTLKIFRTKQKSKCYIKFSVDLPILSLMKLESSFDPVTCLTY